MDKCLKENINWVGYVDWDVRDFHGYVTKAGSTYNAYLIQDEKNAVIDAVKAPYADKFIAHIKEHIELDKIDYVVCNHAEPDHSGGLPALMELATNAVVVCNAKCEKILGMHYDTSKWKFQIVKEGDTISLGKRTMQFIMTPMAHWPESMFTYIPEDKLLFSMDAFGQHYATSARFDDQVTLSEAIFEAKTYYANIIMLYGFSVTKALKKAATIDIEMIAPSHGVIWRKNIPELLKLYSEWAVCKPEAKVLIFFDSMWHSTQEMADALYEGANQPGVRVKKYDIKFTSTTVLATEAIDAAVIAIGTPTLNKSMMPKISEALTYLKGLAPANKSGIAFGSYGWCKVGGQHHVHDVMVDMKIDMVADAPLQSQYKPTPEVLKECREMGEKLAEIALEKASNS